MRYVVGVLLLFCLPVGRIAPPLRPPVAQMLPQPTHKGRWYFAESGHAVYCMGPVMTITGTRGGLQRVATFCRGKNVIVPLKE